MDLSKYSEDDAAIKKLFQAVLSDKDVVAMSSSLTILVEENRFLKDYVLKQMEEIEELKVRLASLS